MRPSQPANLPPPDVTGADGAAPGEIWSWRVPSPQEWFGRIGERLRRRGFAPPEAALALAGPAVVVALCWLRSPDILRTGRFWAEDTMFFDRARSEATLFGKLGYVYKGHYEFFATLSHGLASYAKPKLAPLLTGTSDLGLECLLAFLIVYLRRDFRIALPPALTISALLVVSPCASEHYLNVVNSQWLASAILFVVIALPGARLARAGPAAGVASFLLGLTGLSSCVLMPVALLYAVARRSRPHATVAAGLFAACMIQGVLVLTHSFDSRFQSISPCVYLVAPFLQVVVKHLLGIGAESNIANWYRNVPPVAKALSSFVLPPIASLLWVARRIHREGVSDQGLLLVAFLVVTLFNELGAIGDRNEMIGPYMMRYFFLPSFIMALFLARETHSARGVRSGSAILAFVLLVSAVDFFSNGYNASLTTLSHDWPRQVDTCRAQPVGPCRVEVSPDGFHVDLPGGPPPR